MVAGDMCPAFAADVQRHTVHGQPGCPRLAQLVQFGVERCVLREALEHAQEMLVGPPTSFGNTSALLDFFARARKAAAND